MTILSIESVNGYIVIGIRAIPMHQLYLHETFICYTRSLMTELYKSRYRLAIHHILQRLLQQLPSNKRTNKLDDSPINHKADIRPIYHRCLQTLYNEQHSIHTYIERFDTGLIQRRLFAVALRKRPSRMRTSVTIYSSPHCNTTLYLNTYHKISRQYLTLLNFSRTIRVQSLWRYTYHCSSYLIDGVVSVLGD